MADSVVSIAIRARNLIGGAVSQAKQQVEGFNRTVAGSQKTTQQQTSSTNQQIGVLGSLNAAFLVLGATVGAVRSPIKILALHRLKLQTYK